MTTAPGRKHLRLAAWAGTLALVGLMTCAGGFAFAQAEEEDEDYNSILNADKRLLDSFLQGLGLKPPRGGIIDYRERSPLVVPPVRDLPPPEKTSVDKNPAWPVDPEVKLRREEAAARKRGGKAVDPADPLGPVALGAKGPSTLWEKPGDDPTAPSKNKEPGFFTMLYNGQLWGGPKEEVGTFEGEPPRTKLTEPPPGYQTPSPAAPYGVTKRPFEVEKREKP